MAQPTLKTIEEEIENGGTLVLPGSTTSNAPLRIVSGTAPTNPINGDIWFDGTTLKIQAGGSTKTVTVT